MTEKQSLLRGALWWNCVPECPCPITNPGGGCYSTWENRSNMAALIPFDVTVCLSCPWSQRPDRPLGGGRKTWSDKGESVTLTRFNTPPHTHTIWHGLPARTDNIYYRAVNSPGQMDQSPIHTHTLQLTSFHHCGQSNLLTWTTYCPPLSLRTLNRPGHQDKHL